MRKGETLVGDALSRFVCNVNRIPQSKGGGNKKTSPKATDNNRYAGSFVKRNRRRIIVGREDKSALNIRTYRKAGDPGIQEVWWKERRCLFKPGLQH
jgi:hypothetical protein